MSGEERPKRKWRRLVGIAFSVISLAALTYLAIALITGNRPDFSRMTGLFSSRAPVQTADEYDFDVGRERVVADLGGPLAAVGTLGLQVLDGNGNETQYQYDVAGNILEVKNAAGNVRRYAYNKSNKSCKNKGTGR